MDIIIIPSPNFCLTNDVLIVCHFFPLVGINIVIDTKIRVVIDYKYQLEEGVHKFRDIGF